MPGLYLAILLIGLAGMTVLDLKHKFAWPVSAKRTIVTVSASVLFFLLWDLQGIALEIFFIGENNLLVGLTVLPEVPIEELFFLTLLSYSTLIIYGAVSRKLAR